MSLDIVNINDICRLCLQNSMALQIISKESICMLTTFADVKIDKNDGLPESICVECSKQIVISFKFKEQCEKSNVLLHNKIKETINSNCKKENREETDVVLSNITSVIKSETEEQSVTQWVECVLDENKITQKICKKDVINESSNNNEEQSVDNDLLENEECSSEDEIFNKVPNILTDNELSTNIRDSKDTINRSRVRKVLTLGPDKCDISTFTCKVCNKVLVCLNSLARHMELHEDNRKFRFTCPICLKGFYERGNLTKHVSRHKGNARYKCDICSKKFYELSALGVHMKKHKVKPIACEICKKQFMVQLQLDIHIKTHSTEKKYKCDKCGKCFYKARNLKLHQTSHISERNFPCFLCDKEFKTEYSLKVHHRRCHTNIPKKTEVCNICGKAIIKYNMKDHMIRHSGIKEYKCTQCPRAFCQIYDLRHHYKFKHGNEAESKVHIHLCSVCGKKCISACDLNVHSRIHTEDRPYFCCEMCDKKYKTQSGLKHHIRATHMDDRSHICSVCGKGFHTSKILQNHIRTHTGERPFVCHLCQRAFRQKSALTTHMKVHSIKVE